MFSLDKSSAALRRRAHHCLVRPLSRFNADARGVVAIEFGIVFPVLLLIIIGALEFGRALETRNQMSHALSQAVRVVNLDSDLTPADIATEMATYLDDFDADDLTITTSTTTVSGIDYMDFSVEFPFGINIPFLSLTELALDVQTRAPLISATN